MTTLKDIAAVSGKSGLFKVLKPGKAGILIESLDEAKQRSLVSVQQRLSILSEISMYTKNKDGAKPLQEILAKLHTDYAGKELPAEQAEEADLRKFMKAVLPDYDEDRVYASDIRKLIRWYGILKQYLPDVLTQEVPSPENTEKK